MKPILTAALALAAVLAFGPARAGPLTPGTPWTPEEIAAAEARVGKAWEGLRADGYSGAARIDIGDVTILRAASGYADVTMKRPFTPDTPFEIGSLTKPMTAAAVLKLQDQDRLSVQDPLSTFFPGLPADKAGITLHQLLTHTAGLSLSAKPGPQPPDDEPVDKAAFLARTFAEPLMYPPGRGYEYSNAGYGVLAAVVEAVSGKTYERFLEEDVLAPGGATRTGYGDDLIVGGARTRGGMSIRDCCWGAGGPFWNLMGNGGVVTTLDDFVGWRKAFAGGRVVSPAAARAAVTPWAKLRDDPGEEGYGWVLATTGAGRRIEIAAGGNPWFTTEMRRYPDEGVVSLVTGNDPSRPVRDAAEALMAALYDQPPPPPDHGAPQEAALVEAFAAALAEPDAGRRAAFVEARAGPVFVRNAGIEAIRTRFDGLHARLAGASLKDWRKGGEAEALLDYRFPDGRRIVVTLRLGGTPDAPRMAGFGAD